MEEGRSETEHHEEVDPVSIFHIYDLLFNVMEALKSCGTSSCDEMFGKVPVRLHNKMHYIMQWGAQLMFILFETRRWGKNLETMIKSDMAVLEDIRNFKFIRHVRTAADKKQAFGSNTNNHRGIPFVHFTDTFNPW